MKKPGEKGGQGKVVGDLALAFFTKPSPPPRTGMGG
jgi:hypothetical protein